MLNFYSLASSLHVKVERKDRCIREEVLLGSKQIVTMFFF